MWAHDAPANVTVHLHLRAEGGTMRALVRIPLEAVRDVDFPAIEGGYLDVAALAPRLDGLAQLWVADKVIVLEDGVEAGRGEVRATQISMESDRAFASFAAAAKRMREPLPGNEEKLFWKQVFFDVELAIPLRRVGAHLAVRPGFADLGEKVQTVMHYGTRTLLVPGDQEAFPLEPRWWEAAWTFVKMGFVHILDGKDHLLFVLCLVIPMRRFRPLVWVVSAFTVAHSVTLVASALGMAPDGLWFPPFVELAIALSIVVMALGNIFGWGGDRGWLLAFGLGLVHGFGFSFALRESLQFAGGHLAAALLSFNVGVELGQLAALLVMVPMLGWLFRFGVEERVGVIVLSTLVAHAGFYWVWERWAVLGRYTISMADLNPAVLLRWVLVGMVLYGAWWWGRMRL
jgi:hypothetical protein